VQINYSNLSGVVSGPALEIWNCQDIANCTLSQISATIDPSRSTIAVSPAGFSGVYGVFQPLFVQNNTINNTEYVTITRNVGGGSTQTIEKKVEVPVETVVEKEVYVNVSVPVYTAVRLISGPSIVELHPEESGSYDLQVKNGLGKDIGTVSLSAESNSSEVSVTLDKSSFDLAAGASEYTTMHVNVKKKTGTYKLSLAADAPSIGVKDELTVPVVVSYNLDADRLAAQKKVDFASQLLRDNPECLELKDSLASAALFMDSGKYTEADSRAQSAISGCSGVMALRGKPLVQTTVLPQLDMGVLLAMTLALTGLSLAVGLSGFMIWHRMRKKETHAHHGGRQTPELYNRPEENLQQEGADGGKSP
jgi:hypothetical protein